MRVHWHHPSLWRFPLHCNPSRRVRLQRVAADCRFHLQPYVPGHHWYPGLLYFPRRYLCGCVGTDCYNDLVRFYCDALVAVPSKGTRIALECGFRLFTMTFVIALACSCQRQRATPTLLSHTNWNHGRDWYSVQLRVQGYGVYVWLSAPLPMWVASPGLPFHAFLVYFPTPSSFFVFSHGSEVVIVCFCILLFLVLFSCDNCDGKQETL